MPKRIIDGEGIWRSEKIGRVREEFRAEYANWLPLAEVNGVFEADTRLIWSTIYAYNRPSVTVQIVDDILQNFVYAGLVQTWTEGPKVWGFFVGMDKAGRLPSKSQLLRKDYAKKPGVPNPPLGIPCESQADPKSIPFNNKLGLGVGLGLGIGLGVGASHIQTSENNGQDEPEETVSKSTYKNFSVKALGIMGVRLEPKNWDIWEELEIFIETYGEGALLDAFETWATEHVGETCNGKVLTEFLKIAGGLVTGTIAKSTPELVHLLDRIGLATDSDMIFIEEETLKIGRWLKEYSADEIFAAARDFHSRITTDYDRRNATRDFIDKGNWFLRIARQRQLDAETLKTGMATEEARMKSEADTQIARAQAAAAADREMEESLEKELRG